LGTWNADIEINYPIKEIPEGNEKKNMKLILILILALCLLSGCTKLPWKDDDFPPSSWPTVDITANPIPAEDAYAYSQNWRLGRGVNLGNALEAPKEGEWGVTLEEEYFQLIAESGFDSVRIPIRWNAHASSEPPYTIDPAFFDRVDWAVDQALSRDLVAVINIHHFDELLSSPEEQKDRFLAIWDQIASHYQDYPDGLYFEMLNEPNGNFGTMYWNKYMAEAISVIRKTNPKRTIVVGPDNWYSIG